MKVYHDSIPDKIRANKRKSNQKHAPKLQAQMREWRRKNPEKMRAYNKANAQKYKKAALEAYCEGALQCKCCRENNPKFLTIDHINNDGSKHRKEAKTGAGSNMYVWLHTHNYPPGFQVLCFNCNLGRNINGGTCPHRDAT